LYHDLDVYTKKRGKYINRKECACARLILEENSIFVAEMTAPYRYFLELAYKGSRFHGWQIQLNAVSVQETLEKALSLLLKTPIAIVGSGRTDTGVHASQQFAHFDCEQELDTSDTLKKLNAILPHEIAIYGIFKAKPDAHARFSAIWRSYVYKINLRKNPFEQEGSWIVFKQLDVEKMQAAADLLLKHEDFECFSKIKTDVKTFNCKIKAAFWEQKEHQLLFHITANRFLRGMVRAIVGTLVEVGSGKLSVTQFQQILESKDRKQAKSAAPPQGLYLCQVIYPPEILLNN
jgi:tRNA pseudouridine38-40 synthase